MEPKTQVEIQLGHMCNNRCVFCVSGQQTELGRARALPVEPLLDRITEAFGRGHRKLTILGGEPTLQPGFKEVVGHAVKLGFEEIVLFTNGVKTARGSFIDEVLDLGGNFTWRISIQGANELAHERTTRRPGSFARIVASLENLRARGQRITVNLCVVRSNFESVEEFPELLARYGVKQLHLDMVRPADAGERSAEEFAAMLPRYSDLAGPLRRMVAGFPGDFDVNIGNLPYCIAPELSHVIHHDGEETDTIAVDGESSLSRPWNKYLIKRRDKLKPESCDACVFEPYCSGVFEKYVELYGTSELVPITPARLREVDPGLRHLALHLTPVVRRLDAWAPPAPFTSARATVERGADARVTLAAGDQVLTVRLSSPGDGAGSFDLFSVHIEALPQDRALALEGLRVLWGRLCEEGHRVLHPLGPDAIAGGATRSIAARLARLRHRSPFGSLEWTGVRVRAGGTRAELELRGPEGERAAVWLADEGGRARGGYRVDGDAPSPAVAEGLRSLMTALRPEAR